MRTQISLNLTFHVTAFLCATDDSGDKKVFAQKGVKVKDLRKTLALIRKKMQALGWSLQGKWEISATELDFLQYTCRATKGLGYRCFDVVVRHELSKHYLETVLSPIFKQSHNSKS